MKRILLLICIVFVQQNSFCQKNDYDVLRAFINDIRNFHPYDSVRIYENPLPFDRQEEFFTKETFKNYTYRVLGVDTLKVKKLIKESDFKYLRNAKRDNENWDKNQLPEIVIVYAKNSQKGLNREEQYKISKPIFSKDGKTAFLYTYDMCGFMDCSNYNVRVYKKKKKAWHFYAYIPITI